LLAVDGLGADDVDRPGAGEVVAQRFGGATHPTIHHGHQQRARGLGSAIVGDQSEPGRLDVRIEPARPFGGGLSNGVLNRLELVRVQ
jgi:hypothetical protein